MNKTEIELIDKATIIELQKFATYLRGNWQPYESPSNNIWWNQKTGRFAYSEELNWYYFKSKPNQ